MSHRNFLLLWGGQFISDCGGYLSVFALPAAVILLLNASPGQVGALQAVECGVIPLLAMFAGVYVDRFARRPLMIGSNVVRLLALVTLPIAWWAHRLSLAQFFIVAAVVGIASVVFDTAYGAFLPSLVDREDIVEGNARMTMGSSTAEVAGNSLSGVIVQMLGAPISILLNAFAYIIATFALLRIRVDETRIESAPDRRSFRRELRDGVDAVMSSPILRTIAFANATSHLGGAMVTAVFYLYLYRQLHLSPILLGLVLGFANIGIAGAYFAGAIEKKLGMRLTLGLALLVAGLGNLLLPLLAPVSPLLTILVTRLMLTLAGPIFDINQASLRPKLVAPHLLGRLNATMRTIVWGALPVGALAGGYLGGTIGVVPTMAVGGVISTVAAGWMFFCPPVRLSDIVPSEVYAAA